uniref:Uncharacterized protein n=1 Tax=Arundo donax TaxID=35708 RepID=A0A0A9EBK0_ARUDO
MKGKTESCHGCQCQFLQMQFLLAGHHPGLTETHQEMPLPFSDGLVGAPQPHDHIFQLKLDKRGITPQAKTSALGAFYNTFLLFLQMSQHPHQ